MVRTLRALDQISKSKAYAFPQQCSILAAISIVMDFCLRVIVSQSQSKNFLRSSLPSLILLEYYQYAYQGGLFQIQKCLESEKLAVAHAKLITDYIGPVYNSLNLLLSQLNINKASFLFLKPNFSIDTNKVTNPFVANAARLGLIPLFNRCLRRVFSEMPRLAMAERTMQIDVDFNIRTFCSSYLFSLLINMVRLPSLSSQLKRIEHKCSYILVVVSIFVVFWHFDKHHRSMEACQKFNYFTPMRILCISFSTSSAFDCIPTNALSIQSLDCSWNFGKEIYMFCNKLIQRWSDQLNSLILALSKKRQSQLGVRFNLRLQQSLKRGLAQDQTLLMLFVKR